MINFGSGFIRIDTTWNDFKSIVASKKLSMQFHENGSKYDIFAIDDRIVYDTIIFKGTVPAVADINQSENDSSRSDFETFFKSGSNLSSYILDRQRNGVVETNIRFDNITGSQFFVAIDRSNVSGSYKHAVGEGVKIVGIHNLIIKHAADDNWSVRNGVVMSINAQSATIGWLRPGTVIARDTGTTTNDNFSLPFPLAIDTTVVSGSFKSITSNYFETHQDVNLLTPLSDSNGDMVVPGVGDIILRTVRFTGTQPLLFHYHYWYYVE